MSLVRKQAERGEATCPGGAGRKEQGWHSRSGPEGPCSDHGAWPMDEFVQLHSGFLYLFFIELAK